MENKLKLPRFMLEYLGKCYPENNKEIIVLKTTKRYNYSFYKSLEIFINLEKTNNFRRINKSHEIVNKILIKNGLYISCAETIEQRKNRKKLNYIFPIGLIIMLIDFIYKRVFPKLPITKQVYFMLTDGYKRVLSKAELIGRLISCGFEVIDQIEHKGITYFVSKKIREPFFDTNPSYGPLFKMKRIGFKKKIISVYKLRTMYPYSEYVQKKMIEENFLDNGGKINDDFRITPYGKFMRKYWIDELPMIINWIKREVNIVGVRPLSEDYFNRYPLDLQKLRVKTKPGLIPPYYADLPQSFEEIIESEKNYLLRKIKRPIKTDLTYFLTAIKNIIISGVRSK